VVYNALSRLRKMPPFLECDLFEMYPLKGAHFKKRGIFLALKGRYIPAQGNALGNY